MTRSTILVADDNPIERKLLSFLLEKMGFHPIVVGDGESVLDILKAHQAHIDLILLDWQMPDMDGLLCAKAIRKLQAESNLFTPIICVTARALLGDRQRCLNSGMDDYLSKPFTIDEFEAIISKWTSFEHVSRIS